MASAKTANQNKRRDLTLCCFSPAVMLATMIIEAVLAVYIFAKYHRGWFGRLAGTLIVLLGIFQLSEYQVCGNMNALAWSHVGLVAITLLPILGLQLIGFITKKRRYLAVGYIIAAIIALLFIFFPHAVTSAFCGGNYVIFDGPTALYQFFAAYYFSFLIFAIWESLEGMHEMKNRMARRVLTWFVIGYLSFMAPMAVVYAVYAPARVAVASIMCGFAVILAFILAFQIVPKYYKYRYGREEIR